MNRTVKINTEKVDAADFDYHDGVFSFRTKNPPEYIFYKFLRYFLSSQTLAFEFAEITQKVEMIKCDACLDDNGEDIWFDIGLSALGMAATVNKSV